MQVLTVVTNLGRIFRENLSTWRYSNKDLGRLLKREEVVVTAFINETDKFHEGTTNHETEPQI